MSYQETNENEVVYMFTAWLEKLLHYAKLDYIKMNKKRGEFISIYSIPEYYLACEPKSGSLIYDFENEELEKALLSLSKQKRQVLYLYYLEGFTCSEISIELNCSVSSVKMLKKRGLNDLRNFFGKDWFMNNIYELIVKSKEGDSEALLKLIKQYKILINKFSYINGIYDEDLNQYLKNKI